MNDCRACRVDLGLEMTMAFQPIVDIASGSVFAFEALVRGLNGEGAGEILASVTEETRYAFDQKCRIKAVELAASLGMTSHLSINFMPNAIYEPKTCLRSTFEASRRTGFPADRLIFELTEDERIIDHAWIRRIFTEYKASGLKVAIDDFGAGYAQLNLLFDIKPDVVKLDMALIRGIDADAARQAVVRGLADACGILGTILVAEGVETEAEARCLRGIGITHMQGYLFARPGFEVLPRADFPILAA